MSDVQKLVYALEAGGLRVWIIRLALAALLIGLGIYYTVTQFNGFNSAEAMDLAQVGRQVTEGQGFSTKFIRPIILKDKPELLKDSKNSPIPELVHPPAYTTLLAVLFTVTGADFNVSPDAAKSFQKYRPEVYVLVMNLLLLTLSAALLCIWMARAFDGKVAALATVLFLASDMLWGMAISGLPVQWMIFLVCATGLCINEALLADETVEGEGHATLWLVIAGVAVGLLVLTRYSMLALYIPFAALGYAGFTRKMTCFLTAVFVPALLFVPWLARNAVVSGHLFGYAWVDLFAYDSSLWRLYGDETNLYVGFRQLFRGVTGGIGNCLANAGTFFGGWLLPGMFLLGFFHMFKRERVQISRWFWCGAFVVLLLFNAATMKTQNIAERQDLNSLVVLLPVLTGFGAAFLFVLTERLALPSRILYVPIFALVALMQVYPLGIKLLRNRPWPVAYPPYFPPLIQVYYKQWLGPQELQTCDMPWAGAWYSDRLTLWLPQNREDFDKINQEVFPITAFWLTPVSMDTKLQSQLRGGEFGGWGSLVEQLNTTMALYKKQESYETKNLVSALMQNLGKEQPLPIFAPLPVDREYYYYFTRHVQVREFLDRRQ